jgi:hypothetical protein
LARLTRTTVNPINTATPIAPPTAPPATVAACDENPEDEDEVDRDVDPPALEINGADNMDCT